MTQYDNLRQHNAQAARVAGLAIAQEEFISKDGHNFYVPVFIEQYVELLKPPSYPENYVFPLIKEFNEFREHILQDQVSFE